MSVIGPIQALHAVTLLALLAAGYTRHVRVGAVLAALVAAQALEWSVEMGYLVRLGWRPARVRCRECWRTIREAAMAGFVLTIANAVLRLDLIALSLVGLAVSVGSFAAAQTVMTMVYVVAWLLGSVLLPDMTRLSSSPDALHAYAHGWVRAVLIYVVPATLAASAVGPMALRAAFGAAFQGAGPVLSTMLLAAPFILCNAVLLNQQIAAGHKKTYFTIAAATAVLSFALSFTGAKLYGAEGVAINVLVREVAMFLAFMRTSRRRVSGHARLCEEAAH